MPESKDPKAVITDTLQEIDDAMHEVVSLLSCFAAHMEKDDRASALVKAGARALYKDGDEKLSELPRQLHRIRYWIAEGVERPKQCQHEYRSVKFAGSTWMLCDKCGDGYAQLGRAASTGALNKDVCTKHVLDEVVFHDTPYRFCIFCGKGLDDLCCDARALREMKAE